MNNMYFGQLLHIGFNMFHDENSSFPKGYTAPAHLIASSKLRFDEDVFKKTVDTAIENGTNMIVLDVGEGIRYESHPELAVEGSLSPEWMYNTVKSLRAKGVEVVPKLNFSLTHNTWLGQYKRLGTQPIYKQVCADIIKEVCEIFDKPKMFHLGMNDENKSNDWIKYKQFVAFRQFMLWWKEFYELVGVCEENGARAALWSDLANICTDDYLKYMSKDIVQFHYYYKNFWCNYSGDFTDVQFNGDTSSIPVDRTVLNTFVKLNRAGYDIIPTGSVSVDENNMENLAAFAKSVIDPSHLLGVMQTTWLPMTPENLPAYEKASEKLAKAKAKLL